MGGTDGSCARESAKGAFAKRFKPKQMAYPEFEDEFQRMMRQAEATAAAQRAPKAAPKAFDAAKKARGGLSVFTHQCPTDLIHHHIYIVYWYTRLFTRLGPIVYSRVGSHHHHHM